MYNVLVAMSIARPGLPQLHSIPGIAYVRMTRFVDSWTEIRGLPGGPIWMMMMMMMMMMMITMMMMKKMGMMMEIATGTSVPWILNRTWPELSRVHGVNDILGKLWILYTHEKKKEGNV